MLEIGSEFCAESSNYMIDDASNIAYLLSGRTALSCIITDIKSNITTHKALLPIYCCASMIEPFIKSGIEVQFYEVSDNGIQYPYD